jgi:hypothetical protein
MYSVLYNNCPTSFVDIWKIKWWAQQIARLRNADQLASFQTRAKLYRIFPFTHYSNSGMNWTAQNPSELPFRINYLMNHFFTVKINWIAKNCEQYYILLLGRYVQVHYVHCDILTQVNCKILSMWHYDSVTFF